ncbi:hypothetical protein BsWGS_24697 [Bradybaena similaris]
MPALPATSPSRSLTSYLQRQFPDYFQEVFGKPGSHSCLSPTADLVQQPESSRLSPTADLVQRPESSRLSPTADLVQRPESSQCMPQTVDKCRDTRTLSSSQRHDLAENTNVSSSGCGQDVKAKGLTTARMKPAKVNLCNNSQVNALGVSPHRRQPLLTCVTESALAHLNRKLELWLGKLRADIQADFSQLTIQALESQRQNHQMDTIELMAERQHLEWIVAELRERAKCCSDCVQEEEAVIDNMLQALVAHKNPQALARALSGAKATHLQRYAECLATLHYEHCLTQKVLRAWADWLRHRRKEAAQTGCQDFVNSACRQLTCEYQMKIATLKEEISHLKLQLEQVQQEKQLYVVHVKKAFLRGVCALNTEAMSAFAVDQDAATASDRAGAGNASNSSNDAADISQGDNHFQQMLPSVLHTLCACQPARATAVM